MTTGIDRRHELKLLSFGDNYYVKRVMLEIMLVLEITTTNYLQEFITTIEEAAQ